MTRHDSVVFLLQICVMLTVGLALGQVMCRLRMPAVLGELMGGVLLGPTVLGAVAPGLHGWLFPSEGISILARDATIRLGMLFFLFLAGLEVNLGHLRRQELSIALASISGIAVPFGLGFGSVLLLPDLWGDNAKGDTLIFALLMGTALSISALPVIARILMDLDLMRTEAGRVTMAAATINDLIGWPLFAVIVSKSVPDAVPATSPGATVILVLGVFVLTLSLGRRAGRRALLWLQSRLTWPSGFIGATTIVLLGASAFAEAMGIHAILGAFLVGVFLAEDCEKRNCAHETVYQFVMSFFAPIYFVSLGLKTNFVANCDLALTFLIFLVASAGKVGGVTLGAWLGGMPSREALAVGFGMNARGAMEVILATVALEHKLIDERIFVGLVTMAIVTSLLSGPAIRRLLGPAAVCTRDRL